MRVKVWLSLIGNQQNIEEFEKVKEVHLNFTDEEGPRSKQVICGKTVAIELVGNGYACRFQDIDEMEITE